MIPVPFLVSVTSSLLGTVALAGPCLPNPHAKSIFPKRVDNTQPSETNPIANNFTSEYLGFQNADNSCSHRDLGFTGQLGGRWYALYGDTLWAAPGVTNPANDTPGFHGMVRDSLSLCTDDPLVVHDLHLNEYSRQNQFIPWNASWGETYSYGFGGTSLVETDALTGTGAVYYLVNAQQPDAETNVTSSKGAGIAKVELINGVPTVTKRYGGARGGYWWDSRTTARYGDVAAFRDPHSDYIYIWGGPPVGSPAYTGFPAGSYVYMARVRANEAFDLDRYEYWWGKDNGGWRPDVLSVFNTETAVMWGTGQGQVVWSDFWRCYVFVHLSGFATGEVYLRTASSLEGPWSEDVQVYKAEPIDGGLVYAGVAHPYLDESGRTLTVSWTNNNYIQVLRVTFAK